MDLGVMTIKSYYTFSLPNIGKMVRVFANDPGDLGSIPKTQKRYLMPPCLTLSIIKYGSREKWSNPREGVVLSLTPWCSSYRKGKLGVNFDYGRQLYLLYTLSRSPGLEPYHQMQVSVISRTPYKKWGIICPLQEIQLAYSKPRRFCEI